MADSRPVEKEAACGVISLRRHCPDQVPGGRRPASGAQAEPKAVVMQISPAESPLADAAGR